MPKYGAVAAFLLLVTMVLCRAAMLKRQGRKVLLFAKTHRGDLLLPPVVAFFIYHLFSNAFGWPVLKTPQLFEQPWLGWVGLLLCALGLGLLCWGLVSFGESFRSG